MHLYGVDITRPAWLSSGRQVSRAMLQIRTLLVCLAFTFALGGCRHQPTDEEFARIAHDFLATKYSWADKATYEVKKNGKNWTVTAHSPTPTSEGNTIFFVGIDRKGKVVSFMMTPGNALKPTATVH
jgi:gamma-glutamyltranspeptidase